MENTIRYGALGTRTQETLQPDGATVADVARAFSLETAGYQFKVNGAVATLETVVEDGDLVVRVAALKGGSN